METLEQHRARLKAKYEELCRKLASTELTIVTIDEWANAINERAAVSQQLFRIDLLMTTQPFDVANVVINEDPTDEAAEIWQGDLPEWLAMLSPTPEPQPTPIWLLVEHGEEARP